MTHRYKYAVLDAEDKVLNVIVADQSGIAEVVKGLVPGAIKVVEVSQETKEAYINEYMIDGKFRMPKPYPSWTWDLESFSWVPPVPYPNDGETHVWDEDATNWIKVLPEPDSSASIVG